MVLLLGTVILTACGQKYAAVPINEDVDICAICNMQVKDDAFATQLTTKDGKNLKFDDLGCMNEWKKENGTDNIGMDYVRDYNDKEWIERPMFMILRSELPWHMALLTSRTKLLPRRL